MTAKTAEASNRQLAQELYALFNEGDLDAMIERAAPGIEWDWSRSLGPDSGVLHGSAAVRRFLSTTFDHWESVEMRPEEVVEAGDEVMVMLHVTLRGRDGITVEARGPHVQTWRDGLLVRYRLFQARDEALRAIHA